MLGPRNSSRLRTTDDEEEGAADALDYAEWAVDQAQLAVLEAMGRPAPGLTSGPQRRHDHPGSTLRHLGGL